MTTLAETLREHARRQPDTPFLTFESDSGDVAVWSYAELDRRVDGLAAGLERAGLRSGDRFLVAVRNHPVSIALVLAASRTGTVAVAVDPALRARELAVCVDVARPRLIVTDTRGEVEALGLPVWAAAEPSAADWLGEPPHVNGAATTPSPDGVIELLFTSGTTSRPKAVMWTNAAVLHGARTLARAARYDEADVALVPLSLSHAAAQAHQLWPTLTLGGRVVLLERFSARRFFDQARAHGATTSAHFAASLRMLLRRGTWTARAAPAARHLRAEPHPARVHRLGAADRRAAAAPVGDDRDGRPADHEPAGGRPAARGDGAPSPATASRCAENGRPTAAGWRASSWWRLGRETT